MHINGYLSSWQCQLEEPQADANIPLLPGIVPSAYPCRALSCRDNQSSEVEQSQLQPKAQFFIFTNGYITHYMKGLKVKRD
ncbi:hypothetical protein PO909_017054 [Leuciscus waleckii]